MTMSVATFPHFGPVVDPQRDHYRIEAYACRMDGQQWQAEAFEAVARRLQWTPAALRAMKERSGE